MKYRVQRNFADPQQQPNQQEKKGMSTGAKVATGLGILGTAAATFAGARRGLLGNNIETAS